MPSRPSPRSSDTAAAYIRRVVPYLATVITILWVTLLFLSLGFAISILVLSARSIVTQRYVDSIVRQQLSSQKEVRVLQRNFDVLTQACSKIFPQTMTAHSPSGKLVRGSFSSDGTKYAGYDEVTAGKQGIGVEIVATQQVKHIEIFHPRTESTGAGTSGAFSVAVRWKDAQTIEYDVFVKKADGTLMKETRTTKIYF